MAHEPSTTDIRGFVTFRLARLQSRLNAQAMRLLKQHCDLSLTEWRVLAVTADLENCTLSDMVRATELDKGQMSRGITSLVQKSYLTSRVNKKDQRQNLLHLTKSGNALHSKILPIMRQRQRDLIEGIKEDDLLTMWKVLEHLGNSSAPTTE